jgi:hypothetical protein
MIKLLELVKTDYLNELIFVKEVGTIVIFVIFTGDSEMEVEI